MSQRSITSFFAPINQKPNASDESGASTAKEKSVKRPRKSDQGESRTKSPETKKLCASKDEKENKLQVQNPSENNPATQAESVASKEKSDPKNTSLIPPKQTTEVTLNFGVTSKSQESKSDEYNPAVNKYDPIKNATWNRGDKTPYVALTRTFEEIEGISSRLKIIELLSNYFRSVIVLSPDDLLPSVYLCLNTLAPAYEGLELGIAESFLMKAIANSTGRSLPQIKADYQTEGDLGIVAEQSKANLRMIYQPARLTVRSVFDKLKEIARLTGHSSQQKKVEKIQTLLVACKHSEAKYLMRSLAGKLRIGLAEQSVLQALALAYATTPPNQEYPPTILNASKKVSADSFKEKYDQLALILKTTYCECPNYDMIVPRILSDGIEKLPEYCKITPGIPVKPMLAHPTKGVQEVLQRFDGMNFTCEWKYDGERAQIHWNGDEVNIFSRNQENNTSKYPDIISRFNLCKSDEIKSCILDCEAVAWDREQKTILSFQKLSTRKRKDADEASIKVQVCVFMFDLLYLNGESLVQKRFSERRDLLKQYFKEEEGQWHFVTYLDTTSMEEVQEFLEKSIKGTCEGLMVKTLDHDSTYEIAKRSRKWLKLKKDYSDGCGDSLDLVVLGAYKGAGKFKDKYGAFLLGCYDPGTQEFQSICKVGTGFKESDLDTFYTFFQEHIIERPKPYYRFDSSTQPDVWFDAVKVWEIKCADLSLSPIYRAAIGLVPGEAGKGISLRFPRYQRDRDDKSVDSATSSQQVTSFYLKQESVQNQSKGANNIDEDEDY